MPTPPEPKPPRMITPVPQERLPLGTPVLVTMPGSRWSGFVGTVECYPAADYATVRVHSASMTDGPETTMVPVRWLWSLTDVFAALDDVFEAIDEAPAEGRSAPRAAGGGGPSSDPVGDGPST